MGLSDCQGMNPCCRLLLRSERKLKLLGTACAGCIIVVIPRDTRRMVWRVVVTLRHPSRTGVALCDVDIIVVFRPFFEVELTFRASWYFWVNFAQAALVKLFTGKLTSCGFGVGSQKIPYALHICHSRRSVGLGFCTERGSFERWFGLSFSE